MRGEPRAAVEPAANSPSVRRSTRRRAGHTRLSGLPPALAEAIEAIVARSDARALAGEVHRLSTAYRGGGARVASSPAAVAAYLAYRAPATYAAARFAFAHAARRRPGWEPRTLLDIGAGPGVASWAAREQWPSLGAPTLVEAEPAMVAAGRELVPDGRWLTGDASTEAGSADLVVCSYVLGELRAVAATARRLWAATDDLLVVVEPGTPDGYRRVLDARAAVLEAGGVTVAPCPHDLPCPLPPGDWCHAGVRLARSRLHRRAKGVEVGWEDEKVAYAALARRPVVRPPARIIRPPQERPGHVRLVLCEDDGVVRERTVSRKQGELYRRARKAAWGDAIEE